MNEKLKQIFKGKVVNKAHTPIGVQQCVKVTVE